MTNSLAVKNTSATALAATAPLNMPVLSGSLEGYIQSVREIPVLDKDEERALAVKLAENNDLEAARRLIMHNLRFVIKVARGYGGYGLPLADLIQEGNVGLMKAVKRFDPSVNVRLVSFAVHWIRAEIHEFILKNWKIVKIATTKAQRKLFFNLRSKKKRLAWMDQAEVEDQCVPSHHRRREGRTDDPALSACIGGPMALSRRHTERSARDDDSPGTLYRSG